MQENDELDQILDAALSKYTAVAPRAGLEERVLANLQAEREKVQRSAAWHWSVAVGFAVVIIVAATLALRSPKSRHTHIADHPPTATQAPKESEPQFVSNSWNTASTNTAGPYRKKIHPHAKVAKAAPPKLDQFPSPQPLSEQEKILAGYVASYPEHAQLVVQARLEALRKDQEEERKAAAGNLNDSQPEMTRTKEN
jgi:hypothetical protein